MSKKIGLALSGGGFRAAAFHLGTLKKLNELRILNSIDVLSTISGGSIIGAYYSLHKNDFNRMSEEFKDVLGKNLILRACLSYDFLFRVFAIIGSIIGIILITNSWSWTLIYLLCLSIIIGAFFYKIFPTTQLIRKLYNSLIFKGSNLKDLSEKPRLIINSTNLDTGTLFSFTREYSFDYTYKYKDGINPETDTKEMEIAKAVACSTSVPYAFSPTELKFIIEGKTITPKLVDGGIYDNQGIYRLTSDNPKYKTDIVIVSDASAPFKRKFLGINPIPVLGRIMNVMMKRIKSAQSIQSIYENMEEEIYEIAYYCLDWEYENCLKQFFQNARFNKVRGHVLKAHNITEEMKHNENKMIEQLKKSINYNEIIKNCLSKKEIEFVRDIKTSLKSLSKEEIELLGKHAETLTEIQIKLYCPSLFEGEQKNNK